MPLFFSNYSLFIYFLLTDSQITNHGKGKYGRILLTFLIGVALVNKTLKQVLVFDKKAVMGYAIDNNLLDCHGWKSVRRLVQKTTDDNLISRSKRRVGQLQLEERKRRLKRQDNKDSGSSSASDSDSTNKDKYVDIQEEKDDDLTPEFMKKFIRLKYDCLKHGVSLTVLKCPLPKL